MENLPRTDAELAIDPSELEEAVGALLEQAGIDTPTCDAIMKLIEQAESAKFAADMEAMQLRRQERR